jgi:hypothetical protein
MQQHGMNRCLSIHRPNLSANEHNYDQIPTPNSRVLRSGRPARIPAMWNSVPSEESIAPEPEPDDQPINEDPMPPNSKRRKRSSLSSYSLSLPKTRRQKKIQKAISRTQLPQSPLSAITESTDPTPADTSVMAELPTEISPRCTPDRRPASPFQLQVAKTRATKIASEELEMRATEIPHFARSVSMTSTLTAPAEPLPPLPTFDIHKSTRHNEPWRNSTISLDTVGSSVLGTVLSSPSRVGTDRVPATNVDGMQTFDFGFDEQSSSARLGLPPGRQTMQGYCRGKTGVSSIRPSVEYNGGRATSLESAYHQRLKAIDDTFKTIDASTWNDMHIQTRSASNHTRHSMQDYGSILGKRTHLENSIQQSPSLLRRPASVASGNSYQWDRKPAFSAIRLSVGSNESKKGHKRQNFVRITNLPLPEHRNSRLLQMPEVEEEQLENPNGEQQVKIPGLTLLEAGQPVLRARASLVVDVRGSPSPLQNRPNLVPTRSRRPIFYRTSSSSIGLARPDSGVFSTVQPDPKTPDPFRQSTRQWPLSLTPTNNIKRNSAAQNAHAPYDSPTLPSPIHGTNSYPRKSLVKGPRNPPPSTLALRTGSPSPVSQNHKVSSKRAPDDLRKSIMALRSMNSEGRLLDLNSKNYCTIGEEGEDAAVFVSPTMSSLNSHPYPRERRYGSAAFGARSKMSITMSPSGMSLDGASIWEDASVRGDSPEPDMPTVPSPVLIVEDTEETQPTTPRLVIPYPDPEAYENMAPPSVGKTWKERERDAYGLSGKYASPQGKGLGLRVGNTVFGTPGSLYDRDGFLKD